MGSTAAAGTVENGSGLRYPFPDIPAPGKVVEVAPGVLWIRMALPFRLNHINLWALEDEGGWTLVDTGIGNEATAELWHQIFSEAFGGNPVVRVIVTHMHPDHVGMAGWITRRFGCRLWMSRAEYISCRMLIADTGREAPAEGVAFYRRAGWSEPQIERYRTRFGGFGKSVYTPPDGYRRLKDGETLRIGANEWQVVMGNGHSPEHVCLVCSSLGLFISGDQVLPRITSNVSVFPTEPDANPLADWMDSIDKVRSAVSNDVLVLPSHNEPFYGLHQRLDALHASHRKSLDRLEDAIEQPIRAIDAFPALFAREIRSDDSQLVSMATGESLAHLNWLVEAGRARVATDASGVAWYSRVR